MRLNKVFFSGEKSGLRQGRNRYRLSDHEIVDKQEAFSGFDGLKREFAIGVEGKKVTVVRGSGSGRESLLSISVFDNEIATSVFSLRKK